MRYLLITFIRKPGGQIDELVSASKRVKTADINTCNIILDYAKRKVEKSVVEGKRVDMDFEKLNEYYRKVYPQLISQLEKESTVEKKVNGA
jgi:hypothetical protein